MTWEVGVCRLRVHIACLYVCRRLTGSGKAWPRRREAHRSSWRSFGATGKRRFDCPVEAGTFGFVLGTGWVYVTVTVTALAGARRRVRKVTARSIGSHKNITRMLLATAVLLVPSLVVSPIFSSQSTLRISRVTMGPIEDLSKHSQSAFGLVLAGALSFAPMTVFPAMAAPRVVGEVQTSGLIFKDTLKVEAFDDPKVAGVQLYLSDFMRPVRKLGLEP